MGIRVFKNSCYSKCAAEVGSILETARPGTSQLSRWAVTTSQGLQNTGFPPASVRGTDRHTGTIRLDSRRTSSDPQSLGTSDRPSGWPGTEGFPRRCNLEFLKLRQSWRAILVCPILRSSLNKRLSVLKSGNILGKLGGVGHPLVRQGWLPCSTDHD